VIFIIFLQLHVYNTVVVLYTVYLLQFLILGQVFLSHFSVYNVNYILNLICFCNENLLYPVHPGRAV
jgi:hypothetical protein